MIGRNMAELKYPPLLTLYLLPQNKGQAFNELWKVSTLVLQSCLLSLLAFFAQRKQPLYLFALTPNHCKSAFLFYASRQQLQISRHSLCLTSCEKGPSRQTHKIPSKGLGSGAQQKSILVCIKQGSSIKSTVPHQQTT